MSIAIRIENLSKSYLIRHQQQEPYVALRDVLTNGAKGLWKKLRHPLGGIDQGDPSCEEFWALRDVNLEIRQGDRIGIIGRNGAGKSTLLKVLSRITEPTAGRISLNGRVASLLEVGTGFHPELTGRENIMLNGAILGMGKAEIKRKFEEIVEFAEVEQFLDTPVKRYSSGMYVRLAFAVAAHLEPEILVVDEVLAVGDAAFQKKCLGKMGDVAKEGRTVLFVSHTMAAVHALCDRGVVLQAGRVLFDGPVQAAIEHYTRSGQQSDVINDLSHLAARGGTGEVRLTKFWVEDPSGEPSLTLLNGKSCTFAVQCKVTTPRETYNQVAVTIAVRNSLGVKIFYHHNLLTAQPFDGISGEAEFRFVIPRLPLSAGQYSVDLNISRDRGHTVMDVVDGEVSFEVCDGDFFGTGFEYVGGMNGAVMVDGSWECSPVEQPAASELLACHH
jgi:lipopolysaccharide transport system ATP-binding protein